MKVSQIILGFFALIAIVFEWYLGIFSLVWFFIQVILISFLMGFFIYFATSSPAKVYRTIVLKSALTITAIIGVLIASIWSWALYHNTYPATLSDITLSDGSGTVVFVQMSHIAHRDFYREKNTQLQSLAQSGYTILVEWVRPGSSDNQAKFDAYLGFQFTDTLYNTLALFTGFEAQNNDSLYAWISTGSLVSVDISIDDIVWLMWQHPQIVSWEIRNIEWELSLALKNITDKDQKLLHYMFRGVLNWTLKNSVDIESTLMDWEQAGLFRAIIEKRNDPIVEYIRTNPGEKIAIVYGALHFNWVYASLQRFSPAWKIVDIGHTYPYR